jgi:farnesyl-diphosphate farnesyltransferase
MPLDLLGEVSRTFSLSLAILPRSLRAPVGLAYLLARAADTIADTRLVEQRERRHQLEALRSALAAGTAAPPLTAFAAAQSSPGERRLLERLPECIAALDRLPAADAARVRTALATVTAGMLFDLAHFPSEDARGLQALESLEDLERYTYLVAGSVGEFWTEIHVAHRARLAGWDLPRMKAWGVRFGQALQMTNVLRDLPRDLRIGRCYLPRQDLQPLGLSPADLLDPHAAERARPLLERLVRLTLDYYEVAWRYTLEIPRAEIRMRLACAWPLLIGLGTLERLAAAREFLAPEPRIKLSRAAVHGILARSALTVWSNRTLAADAARRRRRIAV